MSFLLDPSICSGHVENEGEEALEENKSRPPGEVSVQELPLTSMKTVTDKRTKKLEIKMPTVILFFQFKSGGPASLPTRDRVSLIFNVVVKCMHQLIYDMIYFILGNYFFPSIKCMFQFIFSIIVQAHSASLSLAAQCCDGQA